MEHFDGTHHPCLGLERDPPYAAVGGEQSVSRKELDELKQQIPLLDYLEAHDWRPMRRLSRGRWMGLCPLHADYHPSFLMDPHKNLFYCYGCGRPVQLPSGRALFPCFWRNPGSTPNPMLKK